MRIADSAKSPQARGLTGWIVRRVLRPGDDPRGAAARTALGEVEGYVSTGVSIALAATKGALGAVSGSVSLIADALNNLADVGSSLLIALGFRWSRKPRDPEHPFGHGRIEAVATLVLALFLIGVALEVARSGVRRLWAPTPIEAPAWMVATIAVAVALKGWLAVFARKLARLTESRVLEADAWNHTFDILSSLLVLLALASARWGRPNVDGYAALGVSLFIGYTGWRYARESVHELIGRAPPSEELDRLRAVAMNVPGVRGVHDLILHRYGDVRMVSLHVEVNAERTVLEAHDIAERVEADIAAQTGAKAVAHVDPVDRRHPAYRRAEKAIRDFVEAHGDSVGFHDLRVTGDDRNYDFTVDLVVRSSLRPEQFAQFLEEARRRLQRELPDANRIELGVEAEFASDPEHRRCFTR